jgi:L-lysine exporter family protein LysE/ArgO
MAIMLHAFLYGVILAFGLIIPLGPQNLFVLSQGTHERKLSHAFPTIISASLCDTLLISLACFGVSLIILEVKFLKTALLLVGIVFLISVGIHLWRKANRASFDMGRHPHVSAKQQILFTISVSLLNPHAILDTVAVIGVNALQYHGANLLAFTFACILVSWIWFFSLAAFGKTLSKIPHISFLQNRISALIMWGVAINLGFKLFH